MFFLYFRRAKEEAFLKTRKADSLLFLSKILIFIINLIYGGPDENQTRDLLRDREAC